MLTKKEIQTYRGRQIYYMEFSHPEFQSLKPIRCYTYTNNDYLVNTTYTLTTKKTSNRVLSIKPTSIKDNFYTHTYNNFDLTILNLFAICWIGFIPYYIYQLHVRFIGGFLELFIGVSVISFITTFIIEALHSPECIEFRSRRFKIMTKPNTLVNNTQTIWSDKKRHLGLPISFTTYTLSSDRLFIKQGFLTTTYEEILLYRVRDLSITQTLFQKIFGVGTVLVHSSDKTNSHCELKNIKVPLEIKEVIHKHVEQSKKANNVPMSEVVISNASTDCCDYA